MSDQPLETIYVAQKRVSCDGGGVASGHPRVWLEMGEGTAVECPYCGRLYSLKDGQARPAGDTAGAEAPSNISPDA